MGLLAEMLEILGDRSGMLGREITKFHEEYLRGTLSHILATLSSRDSVKGECALFVAGADRDATPRLSGDDLDQKLLLALQEDPAQKTMALAKALAKEFNMPRKAVYDRILEIKNREQI